MDIRNWFHTSSENKPKVLKINNFKNFKSNIPKLNVLSKKDSKKDSTTKNTGFLDNLGKLTEIYAYTDGSCFHNGKKNVPGGIGIFIPHLDKKIYKLVNNSTNNKAEILAIREAIMYLAKNNQLESNKLIIFTDSEYTIKSCTIWNRNWDWNSETQQYIKRNGGKKKIIKNSKYLRQVIQLLRKYPHINLQHIKAHTGKQDKHSRGNEIADNLAKKALQNN